MKLNKNILICSLLPALLAAGHVHAQMYKWVGPDGKVTFSDQPPPANVKSEKKKLPDTADGGNLPPELAPVVAKNPVTLYTASACSPCNDGRSMLKKSGIPFTEKTVSSAADQEKLKQVSGDTQLPLLVIANVKFRGYSMDEWKDALDKAGYPATNKLPKDYRYPPAEPASPPPPPAQPKEPEVKRDAPPVKKPDGFQF
ncbi:glutaredoxin family protein [Undibacterium sp. TS12]|uniref:glutaredoxin family protein n=1 Tax=Undibacterium sp. TS12 TaxID=2908202 RepID=UPI001F4CD10B|nr:glutaredoxin family protein [Undibacterium sp. TS12]MCH8619173.1 glutaredoxin family protein [Undibacterium sp. TS12]